MLESGRRVKSASPLPEVSALISTVQVCVDSSKKVAAAKVMIKVFGVKSFCEEFSLSEIHTEAFSHQ